MTVKYMKNGTWRSDTFWSMNTNIEVFLSGETNCFDMNEDVLTFIRDWFIAVERRFSRFQPDSELSKLNCNTGHVVQISEAMFEVLMLSEKYRNLSNGIFSPFILHALEQAGYDSSFEEIASRPDFIENLHSREVTIENYLSENLFLKFDIRERSVKLPSHYPIDLGGIVKGWSVDRLTGWLDEKWGFERGLINAGGDLRLWGGSSARDFKGSVYR